MTDQDRVIRLLRNHTKEGGWATCQPTWIPVRRRFSLVSGSFWVWAGLILRRWVFFGFPREFLAVSTETDVPTHAVERCQVKLWPAPWWSPCERSGAADFEPWCFEPCQPCLRCHQTWKIYENLPSIGWFPIRTSIFRGCLIPGGPGGYAVVSKKLMGPMDQQHVEPLLRCTKTGKPCAFFGGAMGCPATAISETWSGVQALETDGTGMGREASLPLYCSNPFLQLSLRPIGSSGILKIFEKKWKFDHKVLGVRDYTTKHPQVLDPAA